MKTLNFKSVVVWKVDSGILSWRRTQSFLKTFFHPFSRAKLVISVIYEQTSPKIGPSRCARFVFVILCNTL